MAEAGLLAGRTATTHWLYADRLAAMYPTNTVRADRLLIDHGDVISSGGATTFLDLSDLLGRAVRGSRAGQRRCSPAAHRPRPSQPAPLRISDRDRSRSPRLPRPSTSRPDRQPTRPRHARRQARGSRWTPYPFAWPALSGRTRHGNAGLHTCPTHRTCQARTGNHHGQHRRHPQSRRLPSATFRRAFKNATGLSPTDYRQRYQWVQP